MRLRGWGSAIAAGALLLIGLAAVVALTDWVR